MNRKKIILLIALILPMFTNVAMADMEDMTEVHIYSSYLRDRQDKRIFVFEVLGVDNRYGKMVEVGQNGSYILLEPGEYTITEGERQFDEPLSEPITIKVPVEVDGVVQKQIEVDVNQHETLVDLELEVIGADGKPMANTNFYMYREMLVTKVFNRMSSQTYKTDENGIIRLPESKVGLYAIDVKSEESESFPTENAMYFKVDGSKSNITVTPENGIINSDTNNNTDSDTDSDTLDLQDEDEIDWDAVDEEQEETLIEDEEPTEVEEDEIEDTEEVETKVEDSKEDKPVDKPLEKVTEEKEQKGFMSKIGTTQWALIVVVIIVIIAIIVGIKKKSNRE